MPPWKGAGDAAVSDGADEPLPMTSSPTMRARDAASSAQRVVEMSRDGATLGDAFTLIWARYAESLQNPPRHVAACSRKAFGGQARHRGQFAIGHPQDLLAVERGCAHGVEVGPVR